MYSQITKQTNVFNCFDDVGAPTSGGGGSFQIVAKGEVAEAVKDEIAKSLTSLHADRYLVES